MKYFIIATVLAVSGAFAGMAISADTCCAQPTSCCADCCDK